MSEPLLTHQVVCLEGSLKVVYMDANRASHKHLLGSLGDLTLDFQEISFLKSLESEKVILKVARIVNHLIYALKVVPDHSINFVCQERCWPVTLVLVVVELVSASQYAIISAIVQGLNRDSIRKHCVVWMDDCHIGASFGGQICNFLRSHS